MDWKALWWPWESSEGPFLFVDSGRMVKTHGSECHLFSVHPGLLFSPASPLSSVCVWCDSSGGGRQAEKGKKKNAYLDSPRSPLFANPESFLGFCLLFLCIENTWSIQVVFLWQQWGFCQKATVKGSLGLLIFSLMLLLLLLSKWCGQLASSVCGVLFLQPWSAPTTVRWPRPSGAINSNDCLHFPTDMCGTGIQAQLKPVQLPVKERTGSPAYLWAALVQSQAKRTLSCGCAGGWVFAFLRLVLVVSVLTETNRCR